MPMLAGSDNETISKNIRMLIKEGVDREVAVARALKEAGVKKKSGEMKKQFLAMFEHFSKEWPEELFQVEQKGSFYNIHNVPTFPLNYIRKKTKDGKKLQDYNVSFALKMCQNHKFLKENGGGSFSAHPGHNATHPAIEQLKDEIIHVGFVENYKLHDSMVFTSITKITPNDFKKYFLSNHYPRRSPEMSPKRTLMGGVALLGGTEPAFPLPEMIFNEKGKYVENFNKEDYEKEVFMENGGDYEDEATSESSVLGQQFTDFKLDIVNTVKGVVKEEVTKVIEKQKEADVKEFLDSENDDDEKENNNMSKKEDKVDEKVDTKTDDNPEVLEKFAKLEAQAKEGKCFRKLMGLREKGANFDIDYQTKVLINLPEDMHENYMKDLEEKSEKLPEEKDRTEPPPDKKKEEEYFSEREKEQFCKAAPGLEGEWIKLGDEMGDFDSMPPTLKDIQAYGGGK